MFHIDMYPFDGDAPASIERLKHNKENTGTNWPVVYILNNDKEAYIGETVNASRRASQHLENEQRKKLTEIRIISDSKFNKSVVLDLESFLIRHMASDGKYVLQNGNNGVQNHNYYGKSEYEEEFRKIWNKLKKLKVVSHGIDDIENSELFKYSPYKALGDDQIVAEMEILKAFAEHGQSEEGVSIIVRGGAGTGKTILAIYLLKLFADIGNEPVEGNFNLDQLMDEDSETIYAAESITGIRKIGIVTPQKSLQTSLKEVFSGIRNLNKAMVMSPAEVVKNYIETGEPYDLLLVDEAHRLKCRHKGHLSNYRIFDKSNEMLKLEKNYGTELDWMILCSRHQIIFRDELQTVRPCDIDRDDFRDILVSRYKRNMVELALDTQWRCNGGNDYIEYLKGIFACRSMKKKDIDNYDVKLYANCKDMIEDIKAKDRELGLCRNVAGYAWTWNRSKPEVYTIEIQGEKYRWNMTYDKWIASKTAIDEIGCIHTVQGYDLNYTGVIIGEDIKYDPVKNEIYAVKENYFDQQGKSGVADKPELLRDYLCNIYLTLMTRGIKGTYIYVCDDNLREYFAKYFEVV